MERSPWDPESVVEVALDPAGRLQSREATEGVDLERAYELMTAARHLDAYLGEFAGELGLAARADAAGEEAPLVAAGLGLESEDHAYPSRRDDALGLARGLTIAQVLARSLADGHASAQIVADELSEELGEDDRSGYVAAPSPELGLDLLMATGHARAQKLSARARALASASAAARGHVCVASFGEGLTSHGSFLEALSIAAHADLPLVFVCKSQMWPNGAPAEAGIVGDSVADRAKACGLWVRRIDGADFVGVHALVRRALERARNGDGPALLDVVVTQLRHQPPAHRDPLARLRLHLELEHGWNATQQTTLELRIRELVVAGLDRLARAGHPSAAQVAKTIADRPSTPSIEASPAAGSGNGGPEGGNGIGRVEPISDNHAAVTHNGHAARARASGAELADTEARLP